MTDERIRSDPKIPEPSEAADAAADDSQNRARLWVACGCLFMLIVAVGIKWGGEHRAALDCRERLASLWSAARQDAEARGGRLPHGPRAIEEVVLRHLHHERYWSCPRTGSQYLWTSRQRKLGDDPRWLLAWERVAHGWPFPRHRALFVDGRIEELTERELKEMLARERRQPPPVRKRVVPKPEIREEPETPPPGWRAPPERDEPPKPPAGDAGKKPEDTGPARPEESGK